MLDGFIGPDRPVNWVVHFWPVLVFSFISALVATSLCKKIALKFGIVDKPDNIVKTHKGSIAYLGGIGMLVGFAVGVLSGIYCIRDHEYFPAALTWLVGAMAGGEPVGMLERATYVADFAVLPMLLAAGVLMWRRAPLGYAAGPGLLLGYGLLALSLVPFFVVQSRISGQPIDSSGVVVVVVMAALCLVPFAFFVRAAEGKSPPP